MDVPSIALKICIKFLKNANDIYKNTLSIDYCHIKFALLNECKQSANRYLILKFNVCPATAGSLSQFLFCRPEPLLKKGNFVEIHLRI